MQYRAAAAVLGPLFMYTLLLLASITPRSAEVKEHLANVALRVQQHTRNSTIRVTTRRNISLDAFAPVTYRRFCNYRSIVRHSYKCELLSKFNIPLYRGLDTNM